MLVFQDLKIVNNFSFRKNLTKKTTEGEKSFITYDRKIIKVDPNKIRELVI